MERLSEKHEDKTFTYTQIERHGEWAIFCQRHKASGIERFELVRILVRPEAVLTLPGLGTLRCYQLRTGERVFDAGDVERLFSEEAPC